MKNFTSAEMDREGFDWLAELALNKEAQLPEMQHVILSEATGNEGNGTCMEVQLGNGGLPSTLTTLCATHEIQADVESVIGNPIAVVPRGVWAFVTGRLPVRASG